MGRKFHPFAIAVTSDEATDDFRFLFESLKQCCEDFYHHDYKPETLIADCADAITNATFLAFGDVKRVHCWAHIDRNIDKALVKIKSAASRKEIREDIHQLQLAKSEEEFVTASPLWTKNG